MKELIEEIRAKYHGTEGKRNWRQECAWLERNEFVENAVKGFCHPGTDFMRHGDR